MSIKGEEEIEIINYLDLCCLCFKSNGAKSIFGEGRIKGYNEHCTISELVYELFKIKFLKNKLESSPAQMICRGCIYYVAKYYTFQQNCKRSYKNFLKENNTDKLFSIDGICQCCGNTAKESQYNIILNSKGLSDILFDLTGVKMDNENGEASICEKCEKKLIELKKFNKTCENSFNRHQSIFNDTKTEDQTAKIKEERVISSNTIEDQTGYTSENTEPYIEKIDFDHNYVSDDVEKPINSVNQENAKTILKRLSFKPRKKQSEIKRDKKIQCKLCLKELADMRSFNQHLPLHSKYPKFKCSDCEEKFFTQNLLESHRKVKHLNETYNCDLCEKKYLSRNSLREHVKYFHLGMEFPYSCDICGKKSATSSMLKRHKKIHFDEVYYTCQHCGKGFKEKSVWQRHLKVHSIERQVYQCNVCTKTFTQKNSLNRHLKSTHGTGDKLYHCYLCNDKLKNFAKYEKHFEQFHMHYMDEFNLKRNELINSYEAIIK